MSIVLSKRLLEVKAEVSQQKMATSGFAIQRLVAGVEASIEDAVVVAAVVAEGRTVGAVIGAEGVKTFVVLPLLLLPVRVRLVLHALMDRAEGVGMLIE